MEKKNLSDAQLEQVAGGEVYQEWEYGPDDDWCRYHCGNFMFNTLDLNAPMCPQYCKNASVGGLCYYQGKNA